ncbi:hypothetical protein CMV_007654 [Castanea mollissima]|uniref:Uncharacterized protein n=1 Tax=Castanea mollissima TaxID=60419 RepID=A0A8J4RI59_9ROSI|nr:hypothetical protein CMV_007654 [Castanea mollissima]
MKPSPLFLPKPITIIRTQPLFFTQTPKFTSNVKPTIFQFSPHSIRLCPVSMSTHSVHSSSPVIETDVQRPDSGPSFLTSTEEHVEKAIYGCRFLTLLGVLGSLVGSFLCFIKGCTYVVSSFMEYSVNRAKVILMLVEAIDVYLLGTVMLVFGMGLYELFVSNLDSSKSLSEEKIPYRSNLFGLFTLKVGTA